MKKSEVSAGGAVAPGMPGVGLESEFELWLDGEKVKPEDVFASPTDFIRVPLMHRQGRSYHLPTGGAVYFDTGVIEVTTPVIELERGCMARAGRSLWEGIGIVRSELDAWQRTAGTDARLVGFSTHYSVSFEIPEGRQWRGRTVRDLALLLVHLLPAPVMVLGTSRRSTGVGVRPRGNRIEVTVDFTPDPALMVATGTLIAGVVRSVMEWHSYAPAMLAAHRLPVIRGFAPVKHTSRQGWLAKDGCYPRSPFTCGPDEECFWLTRDRAGARPVSVRAIAQEIFRRFARPIAKVADPFTFRLMRNVLAGTSRSILDLAERPAAYEHVGRLCAWNDLFTESTLGRSVYERVLLAAISGKTLLKDGRQLEPVGMRGWAEVVFRDENGERRSHSLDDLVGDLARWEAC